MASSRELRVHVVVLWHEDVVHTALLAPGQTFVLGDARHAWACPASALDGARSHRLLRVEQQGACFTPPSKPPTWLGCGRHASVKLGCFSILASAGVVDAQVQRFRTTAWDVRLFATTALTLLACAAVLFIAAFSQPPLTQTAATEVHRSHAPHALVSLRSFAEPELGIRQPDVAPEPSAELYRIDGWARCGGELDMGAPTLRVGGRFANAGPLDNADPHLASENGPARPALEVLTHLPPAIPSHPPPEEHRDAYALTAPWGTETPLGTDPSTARAQLFGETLTESSGDGLAAKRRAPGGKAKLLQLAKAEPDAARRPPRVVHTDLRVEGPLDGARVSRAMLARLPSFRACYAGSLTGASHPERLELTLAIAPDGSVTRGSAAPAGSVDVAAVRCMLEAVQTLRFDQAGAETLVVYPLLLIPPAPLI